MPHQIDPQTGLRKKFGGRRKGTQNKRSLPNVSEILEREGVDPILALARFIKNQDPATGEPYQQKVVVGKGDNASVELIEGYCPEIRLGAAKELASYVAPKLKSIEHSGPGGEPMAAPSTTVVFI